MSIVASVIIPTFNRSSVLLEMLAALARQDLAANAWEIIIVDDGSTDDTLERLTLWTAAIEVRVTILQQYNAGPAVARNHGASSARGRLLIFIDNDIIVPPAFVRSHVETIDRNPGCWTVGRVTHPSAMRSTPFGRFRDELFESFFHAQNGALPVETTAVTAQNLAVPTKDFRELRGFDEEFSIASGEDWELGKRARDRGTRILYVPGICVVHNDWAIELRQFCERQRLYSVSDVLLWKKYGDATPRAQLIRENAPAQWRADGSALVVRKALKRIVASRPGLAAAQRVCSVLENIMPDTRLTRRAYEIAIGAAIFRGVREGFRRYAL